MIDLTKNPPFANAAWVNEPNAPCLWCAGTGHVNGDYVDGEICNCPDQPHHADALCECGDPECLGAADVVNAVVADLTAALPALQSPLLKLKKERDEARRLCELLAAAMPDLVAVKTSQKACDAANAEMHTALTTYVKTRKLWDERSWK